MQEAENPFFPHRVKMQQMFMDTILSGHTLSCVNRRKRMTLLRDWNFKNEAGDVDEKAKKLLSTKWFRLIMEYAMEARFYGYSLIALGDLEAGSLPNLNIIRRANVSPDRHNVTSIPYSISGADFLSETYAPWHIWVSTPSDQGISTCGYGLLYSVAMYEIMARNLLGYNADAAELYGMPARIGSTTKTDKDERDLFEKALAEMGSAGYILKDITDEVELMEPKGNGQGFKIYPDLELRLEKKISKIILGHADAMDSTPGKLGAGSGEDNPVHEALEEIQLEDGIFMESVINDDVVPKLIAIGFPINPEYKFVFENNAEIIEARQREDQNNKVTADIVYTLKQAGMDVDPVYVSERTGIPVTKSEHIIPPAAPVKPDGFNKRLQNKLQLLYGR